MVRSDRFLIRSTRIFIGDGRVIESGSVLIHDGRIEAIYEGTPPDAEKMRTEVVEGAGKTLLPGLVDVHIHLGGPAGISESNQDFDPQKMMARAAAALLYSGVIAARSVGDGLDASLTLRREIESGSRLGAELFICGPMFTAAKGHGAEFLEQMPPAFRDQVKAQLVRTPKTAEEARNNVRALKQRGVNGIKAILEAGWGGDMLFDRLDLLLVRAIAEEARAQQLPLAVHTGDARDVTDAVDIGAASVEHGSWRDDLPDPLVERMARQGVFYDPALGVAEAYAQFFAGKADAVASSLAQQVLPAAILKGTRQFIASGKATSPERSAIFAQAFDQGRANLLRAWHAGIPLVMGTDAGNPLVFHGPSMHHELELWEQAGIPAAVALQAATANAARLLGAANRFGTIRNGMEADLLLVDGNPLEDIKTTERISLVVFKGERIRRSELFEQK
jgi:imidazolonepropionase-like amidohydrolase